MTKQRRFTKDFVGEEEEEEEEEAFRLVATSGRTQGAVAENPGIGLSTLVR